MNSKRNQSLALAVALAIFVGCGGGGSLSFAPADGGSSEPGKAGSGTIGTNGNYEVSTYRSGDGAVVGEHTISYNSPPPTNADPADGGGAGGHAATKSTPSPYSGLVPKTTSVTVEEGGSTIDVELVRP